MPDPAIADRGDLKTIRRYVDFTRYCRSVLPICLPAAYMAKAQFNKEAQLLADCYAGHRYRIRSAGLAGVSGGRLSAWGETLVSDLEYVRTHTVMLNLKILAIMLKQALFP